MLADCSTDPNSIPSHPSPSLSRVQIESTVHHEDHFRLLQSDLDYTTAIRFSGFQSTHVRLLRVVRPSDASSPKSEYRVSKNADSLTPARASLPRGRQYSEQLMKTWRTSAAKSSTDSYALSARFFFMVPKSMGLCTK